MKKIFILIVLQLSVFSLFAKDFVWKHGQTQRIVCSNSEADVVKAALEMYSNDYRAVFDSEIIVSEKSGNIFVGT